MKMHAFPERGHPGPARIKPRRIDMTQRVVADVAVEVPRLAWGRVPDNGIGAPESRRRGSCTGPGRDAVQYVDKASGGHHRAHDVGDGEDRFEVVDGQPGQDEHQVIGLRDSSLEASWDLLQRLVGPLSCVLRNDETMQSELPQDDHEI